MSSESMDTRTLHPRLSAVQPRERSALQALKPDGLGRRRSRRRGKDSFDVHPHPLTNMDPSPTAIAQSQLVLQVITLAIVAWIFFRQKALIKAVGHEGLIKPKKSEGA